MQVIDFVVCDGAGALQRSVVPLEGDTAVTLSSGQDVSFNLRQFDVGAQRRVGGDLIITLIDGRAITLENYFTDHGDANRMFISADGSLNEVTYIETSNGALSAEYGPTEQCGNWSPSDDLIYSGNADVTDEVFSGDGTTPHTFAVTGTDGAGDTIVETQVGHSAIFDQASVGGNVIPSKEQAGYVVLTGTTEIGSTVIVMLGEAMVTATVDGKGNWQAPFAAFQVPTDELVTHINVMATDIAGNVATLTDTVDVDTLLNQLSVQDAVIDDDVIDGAKAREGISLGGQVEAGSTVMVDFNGAVLAATVDLSGNWSLEIPPEAIPTGTYEAEITVLATDAIGNMDAIADTLSINTEAPDGPVIATLTSLAMRSAA